MYFLKVYYSKAYFPGVFLYSVFVKERKFQSCIIRVYFQKVYFLKAYFDKVYLFYPTNLYFHILKVNLSDSRFSYQILVKWA